MIFIDSNIWCYYFDKRLPEHQLVREPVRQALLSSEGIVSNTIIIMEVAHYLVRHFAEDNARKKIELLVNLRNMKIIGFDVKAMTESLDNLLKYGYCYGLGGRDSTIISSMISENVKTLITHDSVLKQLSNKALYSVTDPIK
jgi:predicted nucleic acid-binding protein